MSTVTSSISWSESTARHLLDAATCPVCAFDGLVDGCCARCGADLRGAYGMELWDASTRAAAALRDRDALLARVPRVSLPAPPPAPATAASAPAPGTETSMPPAPPVVSPPQLPQPQPARSSATVQSVLAIAGSGLFAIAAIIFTFLNPDLSDRVVRSVVVGLITLVFVGGAWLLARKGLQFSAESVGALGMVFVALDIYSFGQIGSSETATWLITALATALAAGTMFVAGRLAQIRAWSWGAVLGAAVVPAMLGYASDAGYVRSLGHLGTAFLAAVLLEVWPRIASRSLTALQVLAVLSAVPLAVYSVAWSASAVGAMLWISLVFALIAVHAVFASRHPLRLWWSVVAGGAATTALVLAVSAPVADAAVEWMPAVVPTAAAFSVAVMATSPLPRTVSRPTFASGGMIVVALTALAPVFYAAETALQALSGVVRGIGAEARAGTFDWAALLGMVGIAAGLSLFGGLARDRRRDRSLLSFAAVTDVIAVGAAALSVLVLAAGSFLPLAARLAVVLGAAALTAVALTVATRAGRVMPQVIRVLLIISIHAAIAAGLVLSWIDPATAPIAALGVIVALALAALTLSAAVRFLHVGAGFAYALVCLAQALTRTELGDIAALCLVASAGLVVAIVVTFLPRVGAREWYAVLVVTAVPFAAGIVQVIFERSGWTALSTGLMFALSLSLVLTRRPGLNIVLRTIASGMLVPTIAVVVVCLGAQVLAVSASPVTLPVIAAIVALVLPSTTMIRDALRRNGLSVDAASAARVAIEASALITGAIAVVLALAREAAGLGTTFVVLVVLGIGAAASAVFTRRSYGWWVAGAAFTGALWCVWAIIGIDLLEAYLLPPAIAAAATAAILAARGVNVRGLYASSLGIAVLPSLALLVLAEPDARSAAEVPWRAVALLGSGILLLSIGAWFARVGARLRTARVRSLVPATFGAAALAAVAGPVQGIRIGLGMDLAMLRGFALFLVCLSFAAAASLIMIGAGRGMRAAALPGARLRASRWVFAPSALALAAGTWCAIERDWGSIWPMWVLMIAFLAVMLVAAIRAGSTALPPVWFLFAVSFVTAVVAWSPRDLRVEWFSLPLGAFLLCAGIQALRTESGRAGGGLDAWPAAHRGSWSLLAPGLVTLMSASIVATFTDPLTWRAILVMVLALAAIMVGAGRRLAAPFLIGMLVLPIENVFVFSVQIGRGIESMPWWITLAVIGAVLLIIAVTYERRSGDAGTVVARIRDLR